MFKTFITPLVAGALAATLMSAPALAGSNLDRQDQLTIGQEWQGNAKDRRAQRRAERRAERRAHREGRRGRMKDRRMGRKARRDGGTAGAGTYARGNGGSIQQTLGGYDLPEYIGGYNQAPSNGSGSITQTLGGYDLPDYIGGYNQPMHDGSGSIREAIGGAGFNGFGD